MVTWRGGGGGVAKNSHFCGDVIFEWPHTVYSPTKLSKDSNGTFWEGSESK